MIQKQAPQTLINSVFAWLKEIENLSGAMVAGGFIRAYFAGENPHDMDLYFLDRYSYETSLKYVKSLSDWHVVAETDRAVTFRNGSKALQLIQFTFGTPRKIIDNFDFTVCQAVLEVKAKEQNTESGEENHPYGILCMHDDFFEHLAGRTLVYTGSSMPLASLKRAMKYIKRGYHLCDENLIKITEEIARNIDFNDEESVASHIEGMDPEGGRRVRIID